MASGVPWRAGGAVKRRRCAAAEQYGCGAAAAVRGGRRARLGSGVPEMATPLLTSGSPPACPGAHSSSALCPMAPVFRSCRQQTLALSTLLSISFPKAFLRRKEQTLSPRTQERPEGGGLWPRFTGALRAGGPCISFFPVPSPQCAACESQAALRNKRRRGGERDACSPGYASVSACLRARKRLGREAESASTPARLRPQRSPVGSERVRGAGPDARAHPRLRAGGLAAAHARAGGGCAAHTGWRRRHGWCGARLSSRARAHARASG